MISISAEELKTHPLSLLQRVEQGEHLLVTRDGRAVAELRPVATPPPGTRPHGLAAGTFTVPDDFDGPLADDLLDQFESR